MSRSQSALCLGIALGLFLGAAVRRIPWPWRECPAGYSTEYTSSGHKFCLRIMQDCSKGVRE